MFKIQCECGSTEVFEDGLQFGYGTFIQVSSKRDDMHDFAAVIECMSCGNRMVEHQENDE